MSLGARLRAIDDGFAKRAPEGVPPGVVAADHARRPEPAEAILRLLRERPRGSTICPSEVARSVRPDSWRESMERTRAAARRLAAERRIKVVQKGRTVDPSTAKGAIRLGLE